MTETSGPSSWELVDRIVQVEVEAKVLGAVEHPISIGRYRVDRLLGAGGMGRLLLAFDPELERHVALKLVAAHLAHASDARRRIVLEARAMAKLSDPHVAQVYEVGESDGILFIAMEYVAGEDLRTWLDHEPRHWRDIVRVFLQAGAGLAAAHAKGIVHRDFKPDNVVLERDGRARVVDFGLAAMTSECTVGLVGTPGYMAPEQWQGEAIEARTDQFAFCVALFEALAGQRPFEGESVAQIRTAMQAGNLSAMPASIPRWIAPVVARGLALDPAARWPDMRSMLRALDPTRRRRRRQAVAAAIGSVLLATMAARPGADRCADAGTPISKVWGPQAKDALVQSLDRVDAPWTDATARALLPRLDRYAEAWGQAARASCAAGRQQGATIEGCLHDARRRLDELLRRIGSQDAALVVAIVGDAELLPDPRSCLEAPLVRAHSRQADETEELWRHIARVERSLGALSTAAGATAFVAALEDGRRAGAAAIEAAEALDDIPALGRARWSVGRLHLRDGHPSGAEAQLRQALALAHAASEVPLATAITIDLVYAVSRDRERIREALHLATEAEAMLGAVGELPVLAARLRSHRASALAHDREANHALAVELHEQAVHLLVDVLGREHPDTIVAMSNLGAALNYAGRPAEAEERLLEALQAAQHVWGSEHPRTAVLVGTLGLAHLRQGDLDQAEVRLRRSLEIREESLGFDHADVDSARYNLASVLRRRGRHTQAVELLEAGLAHRQRALGPDDRTLAPWWVALGESQLALERRVAARESLGAALRIFERGGASAADYARIRLGLARSYVPSAPERARLHAELALEDAKEADHAKWQEDLEALLADGSLERR